MKILCFSGSLRKDSFNKKLAIYAQKELTKMGFEANFIDLADYPLPLYNQDVQSSEFPKNALILEGVMKESNAWLISSPEHNSSISSALKNLIDWVSRAPDNNPNFSLFDEKIVALMAASPSNLGGARGLRHLREILTSVGCITIPSQTTISQAYSAFDEEGKLIEEANQKAVSKTLEQLSRFISKYS